MTDSQTRELLPEVQAYITAVDTAVRAARETRVALETKYSDAFRDGDYYGTEKSELRAAHHRERNAAYQTRQVATNEAWNRLTQSSDPLVRFIAENCKEYQGYAIQVLKLLPATVDQLDELAENQDWCQIWGQFRDRAVEAGVMPGVKPMSAARKAVFEQIDNENCCRLEAGAKRRISALLDVLLTESAGEEVPA